MAHLINLNIERSRHLDRFIPFLAEARADIVCLQEVEEDDLLRIQSGTGLRHCHFAPMARLTADTRPFGIAILTREAPDRALTLPYAGDGSGTGVFDRTDADTRVATCRYALALVDVAAGGETFSVATTHFPWTPDGEPRPFQHEAIETLTGHLDGLPAILTGDFNAPRGGPIFARLSEVLQDHIPPHITTSLDGNLHRAGPLELMVDGLFASREYDVADVTLHAGVSDHMAISARILVRR